MRNLSLLSSALLVAYAPTTDAGDAGAPAATEPTTEPAQPVSVLTDDQTRAVVGAAVDLSNLDRAFEGDSLEIARALGRVMGASPSYEVWTEVQTRFTARYKDARECTDATAAKRWLFLVNAIGMDKPKKPTKAAEAKAAQRSDASDAAKALIERASAKTPAEVLALTAPTEGEPVSPAVVAALAAESARMAREASKEANAAAREEAKNLRDAIRKALPALSLATLRAIQALLPVEPVAAAADGDTTPAPAETPETTPAE